MKASEQPIGVTLISCSMFTVLSLLELFSLLQTGWNLAAFELSVFLIAAIAAGVLLTS
jgi:hypothetical protein